MLNEVLLGIGVGIALGLTGSGGVFAVPALMIGLGFSLPEAMPVALIAVGLSAFLGCIHGLSKGMVRYRAAIVMAAFGILCAPLGIILSHTLPNEILTLIFGLLLFWVALRMARQALEAQPVNSDKPSNVNCILSPNTGRFRWNPRCFLTISSIGGISGLCSGMLGVGGGFIIVPGVRQFSNLQMHSIVATSLAVITLICTGTVINALLAGAKISSQAWWFIAATTVGLLIGRITAPRFPAKVLQLSFALLASITSLMLLNRYLLPLLWS